MLLSILWKLKSLFFIFTVTFLALPYSFVLKFLHKYYMQQILFKKIQVV